MTTETRPKIYPSSAAFMQGPAVKTVKNSSCLRYIGARHHSGLTREELHQDIPAEYSALGQLDEFRYAMTLERNGVPYQREVPFKVDFKGVTISGRMDFVLGDGTIVEKKSVTSESVYKRVFEGGVPEPSHVAQLASYMAFLNVSEGLLVVTYWELEEDEETKALRGYIVVDEKTFTVKSLDGGVLSIDGVTYPHSIRDLATWYARAEQILSTPWAPDGHLPPKPMQGASFRESPCNFCPLKEVCATDLDSVQYLQEAREALLVKQEPRPVKMKVLTARRKVNKEKAKVLRGACRKENNSTQGDTKC